MKRLTNPLTVFMLTATMLSFMGCPKNGKDNNIENGEPTAEVVEENTISHDYVDMGLPSGTLWATCNIGADAPENYGDHFAWGETAPKTVYGIDTYQHCIANSDEEIINNWDEPGFPPRSHENTLTKYCNDPVFGHDGFTDRFIVLQPSDDAATAQWGKAWCTPTYAQWAELFYYSQGSWAEQNGVYGRLLTGPNGNALFLPAAGEYNYDLYNDEELHGDGKSGSGHYWSRSLLGSAPFYAWDVYFYNYYQGVRCSEREVGYSIRPVRTTVNVDTDDPGYGKVDGALDTHYYVDLGLPSGTMWAHCNLGGKNPEDIGNYFAWGETELKYHFDWNTYKYCHFERDHFTKYCNDPDLGYNGFTDGLVCLEQEDDAAAFHWGDTWCIPTREQWDELCKNCSTQWSTYKGVVGQLFTGPNGNTIFLPAGGLFSGERPSKISERGNYWASSLNERWSRNAGACHFNAQGAEASFTEREDGCLIRPVLSKTN